MDGTVGIQAWRWEQAWPHPLRKTNAWPRAAVSLSPRETLASQRADCSEKGANGVLGSCSYTDSETLQDLGQVSAPL